MTTRRVCAGALATYGWLAVLGPVATAHGQPATRERVECSVAADPALATVAEAVVRDLLATLPIELAPSRVPRVDPERIIAPQVGAQPSLALAHAWVDLTDHEVATLYVHAHRTGRVLVRRFERQGRSTPVVLEAMGQALVTALEALLTGTPIGVPRDEYIATLRPSPPPSPSPPSPSPPSPPPSLPPVTSPPSIGRTWVDIDAGWDLSFWSSMLSVLHGPRAAVALGGTFHPHLRLGGELAVLLRLPQTVETPELALTIRPVMSLRASAVFDWRVHDTLRLRSSLAIGLDVVQHEGFVRVPGVALEPSRTHLSVVTRVAVGLRWRVAGALVLGGMVGIDVDAAPMDFVIERGGMAGSIVDAWPVHPVATLTFGSAWRGGEGP